MALIDVQPIARFGLRAVCEEAGFSTVEIQDAHAVAPNCELCSLVIVLRAESDVPLVSKWRDRLSLCPILAMLPELQPSLVERVFVGGASGVVGCCVPREEFLEALRAAITGRSILPCAVMQQLAADGDRPQAVSAQEREWLKALAGGATVGALAHQIAYSERQVYRRLAALYARLGARGKTEALLLAERAGLLAD